MSKCVDFVKKIASGDLDQTIMLVIKETVSLSLYKDRITKTPENYGDGFTNTVINGLLHTDPSKTVFEVAIPLVHGTRYDSLAVNMVKLEIMKFFSLLSNKEKELPYVQEQSSVVVTTVFLGHFFMLRKECALIKEVIYLSQKRGKLFKHSASFLRTFIE